MRNRRLRPRRSASRPKKSAPATAPAMYAEPAQPTWVAVSASVSPRWSTAPSAPTTVTSSPSRSQVMPSAMTTRQCQRDQGRASSRAGIVVRMLVGSAMRRHKAVRTLGRAQRRYYDHVRTAQFAPLLHNATPMRVKKLFGILGLALAAAAPAAAQDWPAKPVHLVVPYVAGGAADIFGRTLGRK